MLNSSHLHGELTQEETEIIEHTLEFADLQVTEVMRRRRDDEQVVFHFTARAVAWNTPEICT